MHSNMKVEYLNFGLTVGYVFSAEKNKHVEDNIGYFYR